METGDGVRFEESVEIRSRAIRTGLGTIADRYTDEQLVANESLRRQIDWAASREVTYSPHGRCLHWLTRGRCSVHRCEQRPGVRGWNWLDHVTGWLRAGKPALLVAQPYSLSNDLLHELVEKQNWWRVRTRITGSGWHGFGTVCIELSPAKAEPPPGWLFAFVDERCVLDPDARVPAGELRAEYAAWSSAAGHPEIGPRKFALEVCRLPGVSPYRTGQCRFYRGVRLKSSV